jgi:type II protein arginine methyltransferase
MDEHPPSADFEVNSTTEEESEYDSNGSIGSTSESDDDHESVISFAFRQIREELNQLNFKKAMVLCFHVLTVNPTLIPRLQHLLAIATKGCSAVFEGIGRIDLCVQLYQRALRIVPSDHVTRDLGALYYRMNSPLEALSCFKKAYSINPSIINQESVESIANHLVDRWHFRMLNDVSRNSAYDEAITRAVHRGLTRVLDIGAGTGLLSMMAARAGADAVFGCELSNAFVDVARRAVEANGKRGTRTTAMDFS